MWGASAVFGASLSLAAILWGAPVNWLPEIWRLAARVYDLVGVTLIGLVPLGVWMIRLIIRDTRHIHSPQAALRELDFGYISRTATILGLLGTIVALAAAGARLAADVVDGSSAAVLQIIPAVGQALFSTIAGLVIALIAETALHLRQRRRIEETPSPAPEIAGDTHTRTSET